MKKMLAACGVAACAFPIAASASCGAAFCLVNTDWSVQGVFTEPGSRFDLRYESINLDQPRAGRDRVSVGEIPRHHDEVQTRIRNWVATYDRNITASLGFSVSIPFVDRNHTHIHNHHGEQLLETWDFRELGDMRISGRYAGFNAGLKLPTGKTDVRNAEGEEAERTLQPGTGTTDLLLGYAMNGAAGPDHTTWFAQAYGTVPLNSRDGFKPGKRLGVDAGLRYAGIPDWGFMLQVNYQASGRDRGENAEPEDSGKRELFVTPGISWNASKSLQAYGFVQLPVYQSVNGVQLTADWLVTVGLSWRF